MSHVSDRKLLNSGRAGLAELNKSVATDGLDAGLLELVKIRASQINGCAFCLTMHTKVALDLGERVDRISTLPAWRESNWFTEQEKAALAWTEALTLVADGGANTEVWDAAREIFSEEEMVDLTWAIVAINAWNRMNIGFGMQPTKFDISRAN